MLRGIATPAQVAADSLIPALRACTKHTSLATEPALQPWIRGKIYARTPLGGGRRYGSCWPPGCPADWENYPAAFLPVK